MSRNIVEAVIFDVDGTLLDTERLASMSIKQVLAKFGKDEEYDWSLNQQILGLPRTSWVPFLIDELGLKGCIEPDEFFHQWEMNLERMVLQVECMPGAESLVDFFHTRGIPLAVATSSTSHSFSKKKEKHSAMFQKFSNFVCGDDPEVKFGKPNPDIYLVAASRLRKDLSRCLVFEDALAGVQAAKSAGMYCVAVPDPRLDTTPYLALTDIPPLHSLSQFENIANETFIYSTSPALELIN